MEDANYQYANDSIDNVINPEYEAIVVGAGFGGLGAAIQLKRLGITSLKIVDRAEGIGGTWFLNTYPGVAVDIPSSTYSYSFEPNPYWSRLYAPGNELQDYAEHVADKYDLRRHMQFSTSVTESRYDEKNKLWTIQLQDGKSHTCRILILATGFLSQPKKPDIPGLDSFKGKVIHTSQWDHDYEMEGKDVAVIGTGATSVQLIPELAKVAKRLDVYQRTPIWVLNKYDFKVPKTLQNLYAKVPLTQRASRQSVAAALEFVMVTGALHFRQFSSMATAFESVGTKVLHHHVKDSTLREKLMPQYGFGCKRPTFSNTYHRTFTNDHVELITDGINSIEKDGIVTADGKKRTIDTLVLATGFKMWEKGNFPAFDVFGKNNVELGEHWRDTGYESYDGMSVHGFPNFFNLSSPGAFTGLSYFFTIEGQMKHINRCVTEMQRQQALSFEVSQSAQQSFAKRMKKSLKHSIFVRDDHCAASNSYYFNGKQTSLLRPTGTYSALKHAERFPLKNYIFG